MSGFEPKFDVSAIAAQLRSARRVHIKNALLESDAQQLLAAAADTDWRLMVNDSKANFDLAPVDIEMLDVAKRTKFATGIYARAQEKFQFVYDAFRISNACDAGAPCPEAFAKLYAALNSEQWLATWRAVTGDNRVNYVDAQVTRYRQGHFLNAHNDLSPSSGRLFAYVLNLSPTWKVDWGGLLMFHGEDGHVLEAFTPRWNAINLFAVGQEHSVSLVAPSAGGDRLSITGWLRMARAT